jgi:hypothetical protein
VLTNILPGLRELRAPLAAGYLWVVFIWLIAEPRIPAAPEAEGMARRILELTNDLDVVGGGVALGFVAYLVGAVSQTALDPVLRLIPTLFQRVRRGGSYRISAKAFSSITQLVEDRVTAVRAELQEHGLSLKEVAERERRKDVLARAGLTDEEVAQASNARAKMIRLGLSGWDAFLVRNSFAKMGLAFDERSARRVLETYREMSKRSVAIEDVLPEGRPEPDGRLPQKSQDARSLVLAAGLDMEEALKTASAIRQARQSGASPEDISRAADVNHLMTEHGLEFSDFDFVDEVDELLDGAERRAAKWDTASLVEKVIQDLDLVATRLIGQESDLFAAIDRLRAEAEFRLSIVVPFGAIAILFGAQLHPFWYLMSAIPVVLLIDGTRRERAARDLVIDALFLQRVEAPALERFQQSAEDVVGAPIGRKRQRDTPEARGASAAS